MQERVILGKLALVCAVLVILSSLNFAAGAFNECPGCSMSTTQIAVAESEGAFTAEITVAAFNQSYYKEVNQIFTNSQSLDNSWDADPAADINQAYFKSGNITTLKDVDVYVSYFDKAQGKYVPVQGCYPTTTAYSKQIAYKNNEYTVFYAKCEIKKQYYENDCIFVKAEFKGKDNIPTSNSYEVRVCDPAGTPIFSQLASKATEIIIQYATDPDKSPLCMLSFVLAGVLFASMYYSGRSPLSLLDLTSPKLPAPKSLAQTGSIKAPMAYGRMKSGIREASKAMDMFFAKYALGQGAKVPGSLAGLIAGSGAPKYVKALAYRAAERGGPSANAEVSKILACHSGGKTDLKELRKVINDFNQKGGVDKSIAQMVELRIMGDEQKKHMDLFGGGIDVAGKEGQKSALLRGGQWVIGKMQHTPLVGMFLASSWGNLFASYQYGKRITRSAASSLLGSGSRLVTWASRGKVDLESKRKRYIAEADKKGKAGQKFAAILKGTDEDHIEIGRIVQITDKMQQQYEYFLKEAHTDLDVHILRKMFRSLGIGEELLGVMDAKKLTRKLDELARLIDMEASNPTKLAQLRALEEQLAPILRMQMGDGEDIHTYRMRRTQELIRLAEGMGVFMDADFQHALSQINRIGSMTDPIDMKFMELTNYLKNAAAKDIVGDGFHHLTYREELLYQDGTTHLWSRNLLKAFMDNVEADNLKYNSSGESLMVNSMKESFLKIANEYMGIQNAKDARDPYTRSIMLKCNSYFNDLVADHTAQSMYGGPTNDPKQLLFDAELLRGRDRGLPYTQLFSDKLEAGPKKGWWKTNMKWFWVTQEMEATTADKRTFEEFTVRDYVKGMFDRAYNEEHFYPFEAQARRFGITDREKKRELYEEGFMLNRLKLRLNEDSMNCFGEAAGRVTGEYIATYASMIRWYAKYAEDSAGNKKYATLSGEIDNKNMDAIMHDIKNGRISRTFLKDMKENMIDKPVMYNIQKKGVWGRNNEGGMLPISEEVPMSSMDIVFNAKVAYRDPHDRKWKEFAPDKVNVDKEIARAKASGAGHEADQLSSMYGTLRQQQNKNREDWKPVLILAKELAEKGHLSGGALTSIAYDCAHNTGDWSALRGVRYTQGPYKGELVVQLMNQNEFAQKREYMFGKAQQWVTGKRMEFGYAFERHLMNAFGSNAIALDAVNQISTVYRTRYHELAVNVLGSQGMDNVDANYRKEMENVAKKQFKYDWAWQYTVDRHPAGSSTAQGEMLWMEAFYNLGPKMAFPTSTHRPFYSESQWNASRLNQRMMEFGRHMMMGPVSMFRAFKVGSEGRPTVYDAPGDPMNRWKMRPQSRLEGLRALVNPNYGGGPTYWVKKQIAKLPGVDPESKWLQPGEAIQRKLLGDHTGRATRPSKETFNLARENVAIAATIGNANPASTYLDSTRTIRFDVSTAEQLVYHRAMNRFYMDDYILQSTARSNMVKREVSSILHTVERQREIQAHGGIGGHAVSRRLMSVAPLAVGGYRAVKAGTDAVMHPGEGAGGAWQWAKRKAISIKDSAKHGWAITKPGQSYMQMHYCISCGKLKFRGQPCTTPGCMSSIRRGPGGLFGGTP